jgi:outer membrane scaffolding protein for murein synthesis (MipA/OmpV family)
MLTPPPAGQWVVDAGAAARVRPDHLGGDKYLADWVPIIEAQYGDRVKISFDDGAKWAAVRWRHVDAGPIVEYRQSFNDHLPRGAFRMSDSIEVGGFASYDTPVGVAEARLRHAIGSYDGWSGDLSFDTAAPVARKILVAGEARLSWADSNFTQEYFGLHKHAASHFGLPQFLDEDYLTAGVEVDVIGEVTPKSHLVLEVSEDRIISELQPSPLFVNRNIFQVSLGLTYRWGSKPRRTAP